MTLFAVLAGMVFFGGIAVLLRRMRPAVPALGPALANLNPARQPGPTAVDRQAWVAGVARLASPLTARVTAPATKLRLIGWSAERYLAFRVLAPAATLGGALLFAVLLGVMGIGGPVSAVGLVLLGVTFGLLYPIQYVDRLAREKRYQVRRAVGAFLDLIALERVADTGADAAVEEAAQVGDGPAFEQIRQALAQARLMRQPAWAGLRQLSADLDVVELGDVADIVADAAEQGAAIADTLRKRAASLRDAVLTETAAVAKARSQRMWVPAALLVTVFVGLVFYAPLIWFTTTR